MISPFVVDVDDVMLKSGDSLKVEIESRIDDIDVGESRKLTTGPVEFAGRLENAVTGIVATGIVRVVLHLSCFRCLESFDSRQDIDFAEFYGFAGEPDNDEDGYKVEGDKVDLEPAIREAIIFGLPTKQICREDCRGICSGCGATLNDEECQCSKDVIDERWAALKDLIDEQ